MARAPPRGFGASAKDQSGTDPPATAWTITAIRPAAQIRKLCDAPDAGVHFFVGATQANFTVVDALLKPWQGVLCADCGHINVHETGAVEATGHKCLALPSIQGKITAPAGESR